MTGKPAAWSALIASESLFPTTLGVPAAAELGEPLGLEGARPLGNDEKNRNSAKRMASTARIATLLSKRGIVQPRPARAPPRRGSEDVGSLSRSATSENAFAKAPALA